MKKIKTFYACTITYDHEFGETDVRFYSTLKELKKEHKCWKKCGVVEIQMKAKEIIPEDWMPK